MTDITQPDKWKTESEAPFESLMDGLSHELASNSHPPLKYMLAELTKLYEAIQSAQSLESMDTPHSTQIDNTGSMVEHHANMTDTPKYYVAVRNILEELSDLFTYIKQDTDIYPGKAYRYRTAIQCALIHVGLPYLEHLLVGRKSWRQKIVEAGRKGERLYTLEPPRWTAFHPTQSKQQNIHCYDVIDYARLEQIHEEYRWDLGYTVQMALVVGITQSDRLAPKLQEKAEQEVGALKKWVGQFNG